jgi:hypothetical protein
VKANRYAFEPDVPRRLYTAPRAYAAYLLENVLPGDSASPRKSLSRLLATEGVVAAFFHRVVTDPRIGSARPDAGFYARFGVTAAEVDPIDNACLKVFAAIRAGGWDTAAVAAAHARLFPEDGAALASIAGDVFGRAIDPPPEIWLLNEHATIGRSLFDQYRGAPRAPAFDLNAASRGDLIGLPGVDLALAESIARGGPYRAIDDLSRVPGMTPDRLARFRAMAARMDAPSGTEAEGSLTFTSILGPYARRALAAWIACAALGAAAYRLGRRSSWRRASLNGAGAAAVALLAGWMVDPHALWIAAAAPVALFGIPGSLVRAARTRSPAEVPAILVAWGLAALPAVLAVAPIGTSW